MILALTAVLRLTVLLLWLSLRKKEQHHLSGLSRSYLSYGDLSGALREVCRGILTPNTLTFLTVNVPAEITTSFGKQQQRLTQYSLRVASDTLVQSLAYRRYERSSLPRRFFGAELSKAR